MKGVQGVQTGSRAKRAAPQNFGSSVNKHTIKVCAIKPAMKSFYLIEKFCLPALVTLGAPVIVAVIDSPWEVGEGEVSALCWKEVGCPLWPPLGWAETGWPWTWTSWGLALLPPTSLEKKKPVKVAFKFRNNCY